MGMTLVIEVSIRFLDHISGPKRGCRSTAINVTMLRAVMEGQSGLPPL